MKESLLNEASNLQQKRLNRAMYILRCSLCLKVAGKELGTMDFADDNCITLESTLEISKYLGKNCAFQPIRSNPSNIESKLKAVQDNPTETGSRTTQLSKTKTEEKPKFTKPENRDVTFGLETLPVLSLTAIAEEEQKRQLAATPKKARRKAG